MCCSLSKMSDLKRTSETASGIARLAGRSKVAIVLEQGITHDLNFKKWAKNPTPSNVGAFLKDLRIEVYDENGRIALAYKVYRCWVSEFQTLPELDANANAIEIQHIKLESEGWERDNTVNEPTEPT
jgi:phage tail-like protein